MTHIYIYIIYIYKYICFFVANRSTTPRRWPRATGIPATGECPEELQAFRLEAQSDRSARDHNKKKEASAHPRAKAASPVVLPNYPHNVQGPEKGQPSGRQETRKPRERRSCTIRRRSLAPREAPPARSTSESNFPKLVVEVSRSGTTPRKPGPLPAEGSTSYMRRTAPSLHYPMGQGRPGDQGPGAQGTELLL